MWDKTNIKQKEKKKRRTIHQLLDFKQDETVYIFSSQMHQKRPSKESIVS